MVRCYDVRISATRRRHGRSSHDAHDNRNRNQRIDRFTDHSADEHEQRLAATSDGGVTKQWWGEMRRRAGSARSAPIRRAGTLRVRCTYHLQQ